MCHVDGDVGENLGAATVRVGLRVCHEMQLSTFCVAASAVILGQLAAPIRASCEPGDVFDKLVSTSAF